MNTSVESYSGIANFRLLLIASSISALGDGMRHAALPLLASSTLDSAIGISGITVATTLPWLLFSLPIGVYVDRYNKVNLMIAADIFRGIVAIIAVFLFYIDYINITVLVFLAFSISVGSVLFECASESFIPFVIRSAHLESANGRLSATKTFSGSIIGNILGPSLFSVSRLVPFLFDTSSFFLSAMFLARMRFATFPAPVRQPRNFINEALEGARRLASDRLLLTLTFCGAILSAVYLGQIAVLVILTEREYGLSAQDYGLLLASGSIGGVFGSILASKSAILFGKHFVLLGNLGFIAAASFAVWQFRNPVCLGLSLFVMNFSVMNWSIISTSVRQNSVSKDLLGRVAGAYRLISWGARPIGALSFGMLTEFWGVHAAFGVGAAAVVFAFLMASPILLYDQRLN